MSRTSAAQERVDTLWRNAVENTNRLSNCARHLFDCDDYTGPLSVKALVCIRCLGRMNISAALHYIEGYASTGRDVKDVTLNLRCDTIKSTCVCPRCDGKSSSSDPRAWIEPGCSLCDRVGTLPRYLAIAWLNKDNPRLELER